MQVRPCAEHLEQKSNANFLKWQNVQLLWKASTEHNIYVNLKDILPQEAQ